MGGPGNEGARVRFPPPFVYLIALIGGALLHGYAVSWPIGLAFGVRIGLAVVVAGLGFALMGGAIHLFRRSGQDPKPWLPTPAVISTGVYRFTRNPMYVSMALLQTALGIGFANAWTVALVPPVLAVVYVTAVRHEEAYLEHEFGETYLAYKRSVRRWL